MRSMKLLWGIIGLLMACVLVLTMLLTHAVRTKPGAPLPSVPPDSAMAVPPNEPVAVVGGKSIPYGDLMNRLTEKYGAELLSQMIDREAIRQEAEALQVTVSRGEMDAELTRMQQGYESEEQFYNSMKEQLGLSKSELNEDVYYKLLLERLATRNVTVTDAEVQAYIKEHPEEFKSFVQYHLLKAELKTKEEANQFIADLTKGFDFGVLAKERSVDAATAKAGGDLGFVEENDPFIPPFLIQAARTLKINEVSKPVPVKNGYAVIQLLAKRETNKTIDETVKANIRRELALQKAVPLNELVKQIRERHKATVKMPNFQ